MNDPRGTVTAVVLTLDEATHLPDCLASLAWADAVLVLDSGSRDATVAIARAAGAQVETHPFENYSRQRQHALALVTTPWVLFVDADERVTPDLAEEVRAAIGQPEPGAGLSAEADPPTTSSGVPTAISPAGQPPTGTVTTSPAGHWIPRRNDFWGHWMQGGGWWPDRQLRLLRVDRVRYDPSRAVHEVAEVDGPTASLTHPLIHLNYASLAEFRVKQAAYARLEAERRLAEGRRVRPHNLLLQPWREFYRRYVTLEGWKDGGVGLAACGLMAWYELRALVGVWRGGR
jgi:(heptosyl)LPS beta-1,4-glucosyltransferase